MTMKDKTKVFSEGIKKKKNESPAHFENRRNFFPRLDDDGLAKIPNEKHLVRTHIANVTK